MRPYKPFKYTKDQIIELNDTTFEENLIEDTYFVAVFLDDDYAFLEN